MDVKQRCKTYAYQNKWDFVRDVNLVFDNCMLFNEEGTPIYNSAKKLKKIFSIYMQRFELLLER